MTNEMLTATEAAQFLGVSRSHLYKLTMRRRVPYYKPGGKIIYFRADELLLWMQQNRVSTAAELEAQAQAYCKEGGAK